MPAARVVNVSRDRYDVYIGRAGHGFDGYLGNPHPVGWCQVCRARHSRREALAAYTAYFRRRVAEDPEFRARVESLRGKVLGCFCKAADGTGTCHGDVIVAWLEETALADGWKLTIQ